MLLSLVTERGLLSPSLLPAVGVDATATLPSPVPPPLLLLPPPPPPPPPLWRGDIPCSSSAASHSATINCFVSASVCDCPKSNAIRPSINCSLLSPSLPKPNATASFRPSITVRTACWNLRLALNDLRPETARLSGRSEGAAPESHGCSTAREQRKQSTC